MSSLSLESLGGVSETLLIPLFCRVWEHEEARPILRDDFAHALGMRLLPLLECSESPFHQSIVRRAWPEQVQIMMALRTRHFDQVSKDFLAKHPNAQVVMLGCGLDSRFERLGMPDLPWINLDLPEVISLRERIFAPMPQVVNLAISALDPAWLERVDRSRPTLVLAEGLLMYLRRAQISELFTLLATNLRGEFLAEVVTQLAWPIINRVVLNGALRLDKGTGYAGGLYSGREPESWHPLLKLIGEWDYFDDREPRLGLFRLGGLTPFRKSQWVIHYRLGAGL